MKNQKIKKLLCLSMAAAMAAGLCLTGCGSDVQKEITTTAETDAELDGAEETDTDLSESEEGAEEADEQETAAADNVTIEEQVLFEQEGVKITATEYVSDSLWGDSINLLIENNSDKSVGIGCDALIVNNYMLTDFMSATVAAGKKSNESLTLSSTELEAAGIENVGQIEVQFHLFDPDTYMTNVTGEMAVIQTSEFANMDTTTDEEGTELYNENGIRIVGKYVDENSFWGSAVLLYMENNSGKKVTVSCDDLSVNGFMITSFLYTNIYDGKKAIDEITLMSSDLEANGITSIEEVELVFNIVDADTYSTIATSDAVTFYAK